MVYLLLSQLENNLYLVRRIIERNTDTKGSLHLHPVGIAIPDPQWFRPSDFADPLRLKSRNARGFDIRNADPGPGRYTSLAWAVVYGHEEIFEYLLNLGHDEEELSRVSAYISDTVSENLRGRCSRMLRITLSLFSWLVFATLPTRRPLAETMTCKTPRSGWRECTTSAIHTSSIGPTYMARLHYTLRRQRETKVSSG